MKKMIKHLIYFCGRLFTTQKYDKIIKRIKKYEYVSFDVFDTLIKRNVYDEKDIFKIVEFEYNRNNKHIDFYKQRVLAEIEARKNRIHEDITIDEIYRFLPFDSTIKKQLKKMEIDVELQYCVTNPKIKPIYDYCISENKKIIITSDMYLNNKIIKEILEKNDYKGYKRLYVSCDINKSKSHGSVFKYILIDNSIKQNNIIHIGDNFKSDLIMPKLNGIDSILIPNYKKKYKHNEIKKLNKDLNYNIINSISYNMSCNKNYFMKVGYNVLGPLLLGFCIELKEYVDNNNIKKILFLARDAKIIKKAFETLYPELSNICEYVYISRKTSIYPLMYKAKDYDEFYNLVSPIIKRKSIKDILEILEISNETKRRIYEDFPDKDIIFDNIKRDDKLTIYRLIKEEIDLFSKKQNMYIKQYFEQLNINAKCCIVDIGWKGTIQNNLEKIFENKIDFKGFYFGCYYPSKNKIGYLYNGPEDTKYDIYNSVGIFENMFLTREGTTKYYKKGKESILIEQKEYEQNNDGIKKIESIQKCAFEFLEQIQINHFSSDISVYYQNYFDYFVTPSIETIKNVESLKFNDGKNYSLIGYKSILKYFFNFKLLKNDLLLSYYKIGFLKKMCIFNFPYYKILRFIYKKIKNE